MNRATKIIGIGSRHGDDQAGWILAERLRSRRSLAATVVSIPDAGSLLDHLDNCDRLIIIDACLSGDTLGTVKRLKWPDARIRSRCPTSTHGLGIADALELADQLQRCPRDVVLFGIEVESCGPGASNSDILRPGLDRLEACILAELRGTPGD